MSQLRRYYSAGNIYFVTTVTHLRRPILGEHIDLCQTAIQRTIRRFSVAIPAWVTMPEHVHLICEPRDLDLSQIMKNLKENFAFLYRQRIGARAGCVWQRRFWDHVIRDQNDLNRHIDYIHYNPVKHGLARAPREYPHSSFQDYLARGLYPFDWGEKEQFEFVGAYGE